MRTTFLFALVSLVLAANQTLAQQTERQNETFIAEYDRKKNKKLEGQPFGGWVIPQRYWTNTRQPIWLGGLKGKITIIEFFRTSCSHCQDAAPSRRALYAKYHRRGLRMVGFQSPGDTTNPKNPENDWHQVKLQIQKWDLNYPIAFDERRAFFDQNGLTFYPTILVLDKKGVVRFQQTGYSDEKARELDEFVAKLIKQK